MVMRMENKWRCIGWMIGFGDRERRGVNKRVTR